MLPNTSIALQNSLTGSVRLQRLILSWDELLRQVAVDGGNATYKLTSTVILSLNTKAKIDLGGSLTRQVMPGRTIPLEFVLWISSAYVLVS